MVQCLEDINDGYMNQKTIKTTENIKMLPKRAAGAGFKLAANRRKGVFLYG